jgi:hypothetical protein
MLSTLPSLKSRLSIVETDITHDDLLTAALDAVSTRFERECNRTFARTENATYEFDPSDVEIIPPIYPIESVTAFHLKQSETDGWLEQTDVQFLIRRACIISLETSFVITHSSLGIARVTYTGGYVLPGDAPTAGQTALPPDLEHAALEQAAAWFQNRDRLGLEVYWGYHGSYSKYIQLDLLPSTRAVLKKYERFSV